MRSSRQIRRGEQVERPYLRRVGYETVKEASGSLLQLVGPGLGTLLGVIATRWGFTAAAPVLGGIVGFVVGTVGKGAIAASVDHLRERGDRPPARRASRVRTTAASTATQLSGPSAGPPSIVGQVVAGLNQVIEQIDQATNNLKKTAHTMWDSQNAILAILAGGQPAIVRLTEGSLYEARRRISDSATALADTSESVAGYRTRF